MQEPLALGLNYVMLSRLVPEIQPSQQLTAEQKNGGTEIQRILSLPGKVMAYAALGDVGSTWLRAMRSAKIGFGHDYVGHAYKCHNYTRPQLHRP